MSIKIITVYNSLNPGSFLQATSLYRAINSMGYDVAFQDIKIRNLKKQAIKECFYLVKHLQFDRVPAKLKIVKKYINLLKEYSISSEYDVKSDIYVLGSDEIWNLQRPRMVKYSILWGKGLNVNRVFSYAPSLNYATADDIRENDFALEAIEKLFSVSVRDEYSREQINKLTEREIVEVCDPTVLVYPDAYENLNRQCADKDYILVYIYAKAIANDEILAIKSFAKKEGKKIISFGASNKWCDKNVNGDPIDFLNYIKKADYVCTSTFHGTMLSIIYKKQFAVFGNKNLKVKELLNKFSLDRQADAETFETIITTNYDKEIVNDKLIEMKKFGLDFIRKNIENIEE